jgi:hypothetical protein
VLARRVNKHKLSFFAVYDSPYRVAGGLGDGADNRYFLAAEGVDQRGLSCGGPPYYRYKRGLAVGGGGISIGVTVVVSVDVVLLLSIEILSGKSR